jgi:hypothetical protein
MCLHVLMIGLITLQSWFALLCFDLYRLVIDANLDNRHLCNLGYGCLNWHSSLTCFFFLRGRIDTMK